MVTAVATSGSWRMRKCIMRKRRGGFGFEREAASPQWREGCRNTRSKHRRQTTETRAEPGRGWSRGHRAVLETRLKVGSVPSSEARLHPSEDRGLSGCVSRRERGCVRSSPLYRCLGWSLGGQVTSLHVPQLPHL